MLQRVDAIKKHISEGFFAIQEGACGRNYHACHCTIDAAEEWNLGSKVAGNMSDIRAGGDL
jgi:hypothetical protein